MHTISKSIMMVLVGGVFCSLLSMTAAAQPKPFTQAGTAQPASPPPPPPAASAEFASVAPAEPEGPARFFNVQVPDAIARGKFNLNVRLRYEFVEQEGVPGITDDSHAPTVRTRFGFTTAPLHGFQAMIEGENIAVLGPEHNFNAAGSNGRDHKPVVADPPTTELNQAWLGYSYTNRFAARLGRQRIALDNHRFIGDVGWRQNMQTFDAVTAEGSPIPDVSLLYGFIWNVNRVFGDVSGLPPGNRDFDSRSHIVNASYSGWEFGRFVGYAYLLDLSNAAGDANSCATYGGYFAGNAPVSENVSLGYRAELALQTDYADSPLNYTAEYYNVEFSAAHKPVAVGVGYEVLGSDNGAVFRTPLATLHAFNGWADVFLVTPAAGLRDLYGFVQVTLPQRIPLRVIYHKFDAERGGADFGYEVDVVASRSFGRNWSALLKYAFYDGKDAPASYDKQMFWAQVEFNY